MVKLIVVAVFQYPHEAFIIKSKLEAHGVEVFLKDELTIQTYDLLSNAVGGIKLQIYESDLEIALPLLKEAGLIFDNEEETLGALNWIDERTNKIPIVKRWPVEIRSIFIATLFIIMVVFTWVLVNMPSKEERLIAQQKMQKEQAKNDLKYYYLPLIDSLLYIETQYAIDYSKKLLQTSYPRNKDLYLLMAYGYLELDSFQLAIKYFDTSMTYGFRHPSGLSAMAYCQVQLNNFEQAIEYLEEAVEINSDYKIHLAEVYVMKMDWKNAEKYYSDYIADRESWDVYAPINKDLKKIKKKRDSIKRLMGDFN